MKKILALAVILGTAGCTLPYGGSGQTQSGVPITGHREAQAVGFREDISFSSVEGWSCKGTVNLKAMTDRRGTSEQFPVSCTNGANGIVVMSMPTHRRDLVRPGDLSYSFRLNNGVMGQFRI